MNWSPFFYLLFVLFEIIYNFFFKFHHPIIFYLSDLISVFLINLKNNQNINKLFFNLFFMM
jgi:hypothetical protein